MRRIRLLLAAPLLALTGCVSTFPGVADVPDQRPPAPARLRVGAARADLTPRPGWSTYGHGPDARVGSGYWTRIQARAFYFEADNQPPVAVVSCDLHSIGALLQRRVADNLRGKDGQWLVHPSRVMISAIHSHAAPAHAWDAWYYNDLTSSRYPGYSEEMMSALAGGIADAIRRAREQARDARIRWTRGDAWALSRNRSLDAFLTNSPPPQLALAGSTSPFSTPERRAIDPALRILEIEEIDPSSGRTRGPIGLISFFAMHPTVLPATNHLFGADLDGVAEREIERDLRADRRKASPGWAGCVDSPADPDRPSSAACPDPVVALINTNEGDMVPIRSGDSIDDAVTAGVDLANEIRRVRGREDPREDKTEWASRVLLGFHSLDVSLPGATLPGGAALCPNPAMGFGMTLASPDHPSSLVPLLDTEVRVTDPHPSPSLAHGEREVECQAPKRVFMWGDKGVAGLGRGGLPGQAKVGLLRLDDRFISFVPAELTVTAGKHLNESVLRGAGLGKGDAVIAGLSNAYLQYVTTRSEYPLQRYEAASNLYGPGSAEFFAGVLGALARLTTKPGAAVDLPVGHFPVDATVPLPYNVGPSREPLDLDRPSRPGTPRRALSTCRQPGSGVRSRAPLETWHIPPRVCLAWVDAGPASVPIRPGPWAEVVRDVGTPGARPAAGACAAGSTSPCAQSIDDRGDSFLVRVLRPAGEDAWIWSLIFRPRGPELERLETLGPVRLRVRGPASGPAVESEPFDLAGHLPAECTPQQMSECDFSR